MFTKATVLGFGPRVLTTSGKVAVGVGIAGAGAGAYVVGRRHGYSAAVTSAKDKGAPAPMVWYGAAKEDKEDKEDVKEGKKDAAKDAKKEVAGA